MVLIGVGPIVLAVLLGFLFAKSRLFDLTSAKELNRMVFFFALPMFCINMISNANFETFNWLLLTCYLVTQAVSGSLGSLIAYHVWKMEAKPAILVGLATSLSNHMLFILPIAQNIFTGYIVYQITAIIIVDTLVVGLIVIFILESLSSDRLSVAVIGLNLLKNPPFIGVVTGLLIVLLALELPLFIIKFIQFATYAAAPTALFSLGIVVFHTQLKSQLAFAASISCVKVLLQPIVLWLIIAGLFGQPAEIFKPGIMVAIGPCGTMVLVFAAAYNVDPRPLAPLVVLSFLMSVPLVSLSLLL